MRKHLSTMLMLGAIGSIHRNPNPDPFGPVVPKDCHKPELPSVLGPDVPKAYERQQELWMPYQELDFSDRTLSHYIIDTRDFHGRNGKGFEFSKLSTRKLGKKPEAYVHTAEEVVALLNRYFSESGGEGTWRHFALTGIFRANLNDWQMKYIRIYRVPGEEDQLLVCNTEDFIFHKGDLAASVDQVHLCKH